MRISTLTYNLHYNKALPAIHMILEQHAPDVLMFQEIRIDERYFEHILGMGYEIADVSHSFRRGKKIFGVATFYNPQELEVIRSQTFHLPSSFYQQLTYLVQQIKTPRTVLKTEFIARKDRKTQLSTYNMHLTPVATNSLRMKQLFNTFDDPHLTSEVATVVAGDFNYPYGRNKLESVLNEYGLKEATTNLSYTHEQKVLGVFPLKLKLDYVFFKNLKLVSNEILAHKHSDHFPIVSTFETE
jgi:endonuclease/exonuclease/phosphatase family metal-dependent hydrolase